MSDNIYILGINPSHNCSAALLEDGKLVAAVQEERFTRRKNQMGFPENAIRFLMDFAKINPSDISLAVVATKNPHSLAKLIKRGELTQSEEERFQEEKKYERIFGYSFLKYLKRELYEIVYYHYPKITLKLINILSLQYSRSLENVIYKVISSKLDMPENKVIFLDHHLGHAYSTVSNLDSKKSWLVITIDGEGDDSCCTVNIYKNRSMKRIASSLNKNSLGLLYGFTTHYLGMKRDEHEYKVMGLAPYAKRDYYQKLIKIFERYLRVNEKLLVFESDLDMHDILPYLRRDLAGERFDNIAAALQVFTEQSILRLVRAAVKKTGIYNVAMAGGVVMNVKANQNISEIVEVKRAYFVPSAADESLALGAAFWGYMKLEPNKDLEPVGDLYLGPSYSRSDIIKAFKKFNKKRGLKIKQSQNICADVAYLLSKGEVVAWFQGRMEWGSRALGNRSILANPSLVESVKLINEQIKNRDFWMPFAPSILDTDLDSYVITNKKVEPYYMMVTLDARELARKKLVAAMHSADYTLRLQIVRRDWSPKYYKLLKYFKKLTGIGGLLNTSFNLHGHPLVCSPDDALKTFAKSGLQYLAMEDYLVSKTKG